MAKYAKWLGGGLGWVLGDGPIGALIGFAIGSIFDSAEITTFSTTSDQHPFSSGPTQAGDFSTVLLVLSAAVMKSDGAALRSELEYVRRFFENTFGTQVAAQQMLLLREILKKEIPLHEVCEQVRHHMSLPQRLQLLHYLFGISKADGSIHPKEIEMVELIAQYLHIPKPDSDSIKAMYYKDTGSEYKILEVEATATDEEVKKAYRRMAVKYHPDKVTDLGEDVQRAAKEKFQRLQEAYEHIKKERGMS